MNKPGMAPRYDTNARLSDSDMQRVARLVYEVAGIVLDDSRRALVTGRLAKRVRALGLKDEHEYVQLLCDNPKADELQNLINVITTNKTSFFRESHHFDYLRTWVQDRMAAAYAAPELRKIHIWSAGCSTGEEPYSIAMTVAQALGPDLSDWDVKITATDIDSEVLKFASAGLYPRERIGSLPTGMQGFLEAPSRRPDATAAQAIRADIRKLVTFQQLNFMAAVWPVRGLFNHIFCRNVTIYFDRPTQAKLYPRLLAHLEPEGRFFAGHSENLAWLPELLRPAGLTIYSHAKYDVSSESKASTPKAIPSPMSTPRFSVPASAPSPSAYRDAPSPSQNISRSLPPRVPSPPQSEVRIAASLPPAARTASSKAELPEKSLQAGDVIASAEPMILRTALGSCISVCMYDPIAKLGGMNHFMLPSSKAENETNNRFGVQAMETLINKLLRMGAGRHRLVAKIAGACRVINVNMNGGTVAERNLAFVDEFMQLEGFKVVGRKVGGPRAMEVRFRTDTGEALVRAVEASWTSRIALEDEEYAKKLAKPVAPANIDDGVTWFVDPAAVKQGQR